MSGSLSDVSLASAVKAPAHPPDDLEWQSFPSSSASSAPTAPAAAAAAAAAGEAAAAASSATAALVVPDAIASPTACLTLSFYRHMFDVGSGDVRDRLVAALWPLSRGTFLAVCRNKPDWYGPVWICATLIFAIGAGANLSSWLSWSPGGGGGGGGAAAAASGALSIWKYDFRLVTLAAATVYPFAFALSTLLWLLLNHLGVTGLPLVHLICIYGYSLAVFVPSAVRARAPPRGRPPACDARRPPAAPLPPPTRSSSACCPAPVCSGPSRCSPRRCRRSLSSRASTPSCSRAACQWRCAARCRSSSCCSWPLASCSSSSSSHFRAEAAVLKL